MKSLAAESEPLIRFDEPSVLQKWKIGHNPLKRDGMELSSKFALSSRNSLLLIAPRWEPGLPEWPLWQTAKSFVGDWSAYDRLVLDLVNPTDAVELVGLKAVDSETATLSSANWAGTKVSVAPRAHLRAVVPLSLLMKGIRKPIMDQTDIAVLMLYATRPASDFQLYVSGIQLLRAGEEPARLPADYIKQLVVLALDPALQKSRAAIAKSTSVLSSITNPVVKTWAQERLESARARLHELERKIEIPDFQETEIAPMVESLHALTLDVNRLPSLAALRVSAQSSDRDYVAGWVSSMQKVIPREMPLPLLENKNSETLSLARNEFESLQLVVVPLDHELKNVRVEAGRFTTSDGKVLPPDSVVIETVGFVRTKKVAYEVDYSGWWPDPLLDFLPSVSIAPEEAQSFWVRVHAPKDLEPGSYEGEITITPENALPWASKLTVKVWDFTLSGKPSIPVAIPSCSQRYFEEFSSGDWNTQKLKIADFQADYYISWDNLYDQRAPDWDVLMHLQSQGRLGMFNLYPLGFSRGSLLRAVSKGGSIAEAVRALVEKIKPVYEQAKRYGLLDHAYFYGMDELPADLFPELAIISEAVKSTFPDVPIVTTAQDFSFGEKSGIKSIDAWVPLIHEYDPVKAEAAREKGLSVWWYNCKTPAHPYPNQFTEYPAIELRLLHGAISAKYRPDGFLYYSLFRSWTPEGDPPRRAIDKGPYTDWNPCALAFSEYDIYNGEGYLAYPGPDGRPLPSIRLENFRDGFEDLAYQDLLEEKIKALASKEKQLTIAQSRWLTEAKAALEVPEDLVKSAHEFTLAPERVRAWRDRLADLIESCPESSSTPNQP